MKVNGRGRSRWHGSPCQLGVTEQMTTTAPASPGQPRPALWHTHTEVHPGETRTCAGAVVQGAPASEVQNCTHVVLGQEAPVGSNVSGDKSTGSKCPSTAWSETGVLLGTERPLPAEEKDLHLLQDPSQEGCCLRGWGRGGMTVQGTG